MLGTNPIAKPRLSNDGFLVHSIWPTLQGEGPYAGMPAIFVRLGGCNLRCHFCDTEFDEGVTPYTKEELIADVARMANLHKFNLVVITGGEPMLQPLKHLIDARFFTPNKASDHRLASVHFQIETAGSVWPVDGLTDSMSIQHPGLTIVCSPKTPEVAHQLISRTDVYWKYIIRADDEFDTNDGLPISSTQIKGRPARLFRPGAVLASRTLRQRHIFVQACDEGDEAANIANLTMATKIALQYGYRLSVQMHKIAGVP